MARRLDRSLVLALASHNPGKIREIGELFAPYVAEVRTIGNLPEPEESGETFLENAAIKARAAAMTSGLVAIADDSGLVVPALGGAPGVHSARWAGRDFARAMERIHRELGERDRSATMITALALAWPDGHVEAFQGRVDGTLTWPPRGTHGFGYEPMFVPSGAAVTYGEMERAEKHRDDPRARAFALLRAQCLQLQ